MMTLTRGVPRGAASGIVALSAFIARGSARANDGLCERAQPVTHRISGAHARLEIDQRVRTENRDAAEGKRWIRRSGQPDLHRACGFVATFCSDGTDALVLCPERIRQLAHGVTDLLLDRRPGPRELIAA